jgi:hypothetical protein
MQMHLKSKGQHQANPSPKQVERERMQCAISSSAHWGSLVIQATLVSWLPGKTPVYIIANHLQVIYPPVD